MLHIYTRVSTKQQADSKGGLQAQHQTCVSYANQNGEEYSFDPDCQDAGISARIHPYDRPGFGNLMKKIGTGDCILVYRRDRIARDSLQLAILERDLNRQGIQIVQVNGIGNGDSPEDKLVKSILDAISEYERALIRMRTKASKQAKKENGEVYCSSVYGWKNVDGHMVRNEEEQSIISDILYYQQNGMSLRKICQYLNDDNIPAPRGEKWYPATISGILKRYHDKA